MREVQHTKKYILNSFIFTKCKNSKINQWGQKSEIWLGYPAGGGGGGRAARENVIEWKRIHGKFLGNGNTLLIGV